MSPLPSAAAIGVVGVPTNSAGTTDGVARAPAALRDAGLIEALERSSSVVDYGDLRLPEPSPVRDAETGVIDPDGLRAMVEAVRERVGRILSEARFPLVVGGDCPVLLGCLSSFGDAGDRGLLFVDGHEDAYAPERSTSGEAADMELGFALGTVDTPWWPELHARAPLVTAERTRLLGPRDRAAIEGYGQTPLGDPFSVRDASALARDPVAITSDAVDALSARRWWLHLDLDVLSTEALPAIDYPQQGGLSWGQLETVIGTALEAGPVGWDVTIYNPDLDPNGEHARRIVEFLGAMAPRLVYREG
ncbi:MAG TPA: arginase family protein [Actinomycetota bacterium]|nr:arginase family protein [Actinomycetota bacterium]